MASIARVNGGVHKQGSAQAGAISADELVIQNGPELDFFKIIATNGSSEVLDIRAELEVGESIEAIMTAIQTKANIAMYQVEGDTSGQVSVAVYPTAAWTASTLQVAIRALGASVGGNTIDLSGSAVTSSGLEFV